LWLSLFTYKNVTMRKLLLILSIIILSSFGEIAAWGKIGHRTIGEIAQRQLSLTAEQRINEILNGQSLAVVSTWADEMRSNPEFDNFSKWHYINLPIDKEYDEIEVKQENVIMIIDRAVAILKSPSADKKMKSFYLKYLVHMVGDLHQPLHTGREEDWGGNKIKVNFKGRKGADNITNLHDLWDAGIIDDYKMSYTEYADKLINQFKLAIDTFERANNLSVCLRGDHKIAANALRQFVQMCLDDLNFYSEDKKKDSEAYEINLLSQLDHEKEFQANYLHFMNPNHAEYLTLKSYSHMNAIAEDMLLIDLSTNSIKNFERAKNIVIGFNLAKTTISYAIQNPASFEGMIDEFEIINTSRSDNLNQQDFTKLCDMHIEYMKLWREYYSINEQTFKDIYIDNLSLEESEYDLIQHEALSYQSKINQYGIEISKLTLEFMNIDVPHIEVFSNKLIDNPLSFMRTS